STNDSLGVRLYRGREGRLRNSATARGHVPSIASGVAKRSAKENGVTRSVLVVGIFAATLVLALTKPRRIHEAVWTTCGAAAMLSVGAVDARGLRAIYDASRAAILFLVALLVLSALVDKSGLFEWAALRAARSARGDGRVLFRNVFVLGAVVTATLSLDTTAVLLTPVVLSFVRRLDVNARPYVVACAFVANAGSLALPVSNLTNLILAGAFHVSFAGFVVHMLPVQVGVLLVTYTSLRRHFVSELGRFDATKVDAGAADFGTVIPHRRYFLTTVGVLATALGGYLVAPLFAIEPYVIAFAASGVLAVAGGPPGRGGPGAAPGAPRHRPGCLVGRRSVRHRTLSRRPGPRRTRPRARAGATHRGCTWRRDRTIPGDHRPHRDRLERDEQPARGARGPSGPRSTRRSSGARLRDPRRHERRSERGAVRVTGHVARSHPRARAWRAGLGVVVRARGPVGDTARLPPGVAGDRAHHAVSAATGDARPMATPTPAAQRGGGCANRDCGNARAESRRAFSASRGSRGGERSIPRAKRPSRSSYRISRSTFGDVSPRTKVVSTTCDSRVSPNSVPRPGRGAGDGAARAARADPMAPPASAASAGGGAASGIAGLVEGC